MGKAKAHRKELVALAYGMGGARSARLTSAKPELPAPLALEQRPLPIPTPSTLVEMDFSALERRILAWPNKETLLGVDPGARDGSATVLWPRGQSKSRLKDMATALTIPQVSTKVASRDKFVLDEYSVTGGDMASGKTLAAYYCSMQALTEKAFGVTPEILHGTVTGRVAHDRPNTSFDLRGLDALDSSMRMKMSRKIDQALYGRDLTSSLAYAYDQRRGESSAADNLQAAFEHDTSPDFVANPFSNAHDLEVIDRLIWGPNGEFTGVPRTEHFNRTFLHRRSGGRPFQVEDDRDGYRDRIRGSGCNSRFLAAHLGGRYDHYSYPTPSDNFYDRIADRPVEHDAIFEVRVMDYADLVEWCYYLCETHRRGLVGRPQESYGKPTTLWARMSPEAAIWVGALQTMGVQIDPVKAWAEALSKGSLAFGYGMLRDQEDRFDALGVLAELNDADWVLNSKEGGYSVEGDCYSLSPRRVADYLGVAGKTSELFHTFVKELHETALGATSHQNFGSELHAALSTTVELRKMTLEAQHNAHTRNHSIIGAAELDSDSVTTFRDPLGIKRW